MTPDDVCTVQQSWVELRRVQASLINELSRQYHAAASPSSLLPDLRAAWLCVAVDGTAFMAAAAACAGRWTRTTESAWRQAWLLLADELAAEALSPFADGWQPD